MKKKFLLTIAYDGTNYAGWQRQKDRNVRTIEAELAAACQKLFRQEVEIVGASRTDSGVHAFGQRATIFTETSIPAEKIHLAINPFLPEDIVIQKVIEVPEAFHCRYDVIDKTYEYKFYTAEVRNPIFMRYAEFNRGKLDILKMRQAGKAFLGEHDFAAFCAAGSQTKTTVRQIYLLEVLEEGPFVSIRINGNGFLYNMVRIIAGTLLYVGQGKWNPEELPAIIERKDRRLAGKTVPAKGLCLLEIHYPKHSMNGNF